MRSMLIEHVGGARGCFAFAVLHAVVIWRAKKYSGKIAAVATLLRKAAAKRKRSSSNKYAQMPPGIGRWASFRILPAGGWRGERTVLFFKPEWR